MSDFNCPPPPPTPSAEDLADANASAIQVALDSLNLSSCVTSGSKEICLGFKTFLGCLGNKVDGQTRSVGCDQVIAYSQAINIAQNSLTCVLNQQTVTESASAVGINRITVNLDGLTVGGDIVFTQLVENNVELHQSFTGAFQTEIQHTMQTLAEATADFVQNAKIQGTVEDTGQNIVDELAAQIVQTDSVTQMTVQTIDQMARVFAQNIVTVNAQNVTTEGDLIINQTVYNAVLVSQAVAVSADLMFQSDLGIDFKSGFYAEQGKDLSGGGLKTWQIVLIVIGVLAIIALIGWAIWKGQKAAQKYNDNKNKK